MPRAAKVVTEEPTVDRPDSEGIVGILVQKAYDFASEKESLYTKIQANRRSLRDLNEQGVLNEDESRWLLDFYKPRKTSDDTEDEAGDDGEDGNGDDTL